MKPLHEQGVHELAEALTARRISSVEITEHLLARVQAHASLGVLLHHDAEVSLALARAADARRAKGATGPLLGVPLAHKDIFVTRDMPSTAGSKMLQGYASPFDATVVAKLADAGAVMLGKLNCDEFAMGSSNQNSAYGPVRNPWDLTRVPGGSSGGSAAAVAARLMPAATGSDTGGSIRQPAGFCGVVGMKPTYGRVSRFGLVAYASSLDQIGPFANDVAGAALLLEAIAGHDSRDSTSVASVVPEYSLTVEEPLAGLKVGIAKEHFVSGLDRDVEQAIRQALDVYRSLGAEIREISLPHSKYAVAVYYIVAPSEASSNLARYDGVHYGRRAAKFDNMIDMYSASRAEGFGPEVKRRIMLGTYALSAGYYDAYYLKALKVRRLIRNDFDEAFRSVDVIASPVAPTPAFKIGELVDDPLAMDIYTISANLAGLPGISIPAGFSQGRLPIGLQLLAPPFEEDRLLRTARMFERETDWHRQRPSVT